MLLGAIPSSFEDNAPFVSKILTFSEVLVKDDGMRQKCFRETGRF